LAISLYKHAMSADLYKKTMAKRLTNITKAILPLTDLFSQEDIENILRNENVKVYAGKILPSTWRTAADKNNRSRIIEVALRGLEKNTPDNASYEKAILLADAMQVFAARVVKEIDSPQKKN